MIDAQGFRANVAIVLIGPRGNVFWGKRYAQTSWQFSQGGIDRHESPLVAMYRELREELGLLPHQVELVAATRGWLRYRLPKYMVRSRGPVCIGQKQKWFLLRLLTDERAIHFNETQRPEFDDWRWVHYWYPVKQVVSFKQGVYQRALRYFHPIVRELLDAQRQRRSGAARKR